MPNTFATKVDYSFLAASMTVGDVNGDDKPDIIVNSGGVLSVFKNQGSGTFDTKVDYAPGSGAYSVAVVVDVNADGKPDLVTINQATNKTSVLRNQGNGTFAPKVDYATGSDPESVAVVDVNGDGKPDIVTANKAPDTISVLRNQGNGTFAPKVDYATAPTPIGVAVVDVNGDSKLDIVTANGGGTVSVLRNQGNGTFATKVDYAAAPSPTSVAVVDVNGDSKPDIVTVDPSSGIFLLLNQGSGSFGTRVNLPPDVCNKPFLLAVIDVNGDGKPDIVTAGNSDDSVDNAQLVNQGVACVSINQGGGTFFRRMPYATGTGPRSVAVVDVNGDGKPDIVTANGVANTISVLLATCSGVTEAGPSCTPCANNQYAIDHSTCAPCGAGNSVNANFSSSCTPCAAGYYNSIGNGTACIIAPAGTYVEGTGFTKPMPCPAGTYSTAIGATSSDTCVAVSAGSFTNTKTGATSYTQCPSGYYNPGVGYGSSYADTNACKQCPAGFITSLNATVCAPCSNTIQVNSTGLYNGTSCNDIFEITTLSNVTIDLCSGGADTIIAHSTSNPNQQITLRCFNTSDDKVQFSGAQCIDDKDFNFTDC